MFEDKKHVKDLAVIDMLLFKGRIEYQETLNAWKQVPHVMKWFAEEEVSLSLAGHQPEPSSSLPHSLLRILLTPD